MCMNDEDVLYHSVLLSANKESLLHVLLRIYIKHCEAHTQLSHSMKLCQVQIHDDYFFHIALLSSKCCAESKIYTKMWCRSRWN